MKLKRARLYGLIGVLVAMVRRAARELDPKTAAALLDDLIQTLHDYGWKE